jgi:16S rRNA processing protein RimM
MEKVTLGQIINVVGLQGELKLKSLTHFSSLRYKKGASIFLEQNGSMMLYHVSRHRHQQGIDFVVFEEVKSRTEAERLKGLYAYANKEEIRLDTNSFFFSDLIGCKVFSLSNEFIGDVIRIEEHGIQNHLRVNRENKPSIIIPFFHVFIKHVDIQQKLIQVDVWDGML